MTKPKEILDRLFTVNFFLMIVNLLGFVFTIQLNHLPEGFFTLAVLICYAFIYLIPAGLLITLSRWSCQILGQGQRPFATPGDPAFRSRRR